VVDGTASPGYVALGSVINVIGARSILLLALPLVLVLVLVVSSAADVVLENGYDAFSVG
jgi:hypothetical protein